MRNKLAHAYDLVDYGIVWDTAHKELPVLAMKLRKVLRQKQLVLQCRAQLGLNRPQVHVLGPRPVRRIPFDGQAHALREGGLASGTLAVLEAARRHDVGKLVYAASSSAYGDTVQLLYADCAARGQMPYGMWIVATPCSCATAA